MKTLKVFSLALVVTLVAAFPAGAGARRSRSLILKDCYEQAASVQIPRSQAQAFLPEGFTATGGAAGQTEVVHMYVTSFVCGGDKPALEMYRTYVSVDPPSNVQGSSSAQYFLIDVGASKPAGARFAKFACMGSVVEEADVEATQTLDPGELGQPGAGTSTISSPSLSVSFTVAGTGLGLDGESLNRWFFLNEDGETDYYDTFESIRAVAMGAGEIRFAEEYEGVPLAGPALSLYRLKDATVLPSPSCAR
jgi:hypothetical protein